MAIIPPNDLSNTHKKAVREQLNRLLHSRQFQRSPRRGRFLKYIVDETLAGRSNGLTGYKLALEVFGRSETFDPVVDPVVRVEAGRLRDKLREYYAADGQGDPVHIHLPTGTYAPQIELRHEFLRPDKNLTLTQKPTSTIPSLAVLPFDDLSASKNIGHLGDGMAEDIITTLSRFPDVLVVARSSSFSYRGKNIDLRRVGEELKVGYVLEGSVRKDGDKLRVISQLIETKGGTHVWAERFDRSGTNPWALQDEITGMIVSAMTGETGALKQAQHRQAWGKATLDEYDYYLRGHDQFMKYTKEGIERSGKIWNEGLTKFPGSPLLKIKLAWFHMASLMNFVSNDPVADLKQAGQLARQVLASEHLSPQVTRLANWLMSHVLVHERDFEGAIIALRSAVALAPHDGFMHSSLMMVLVQVGRKDEALQWASQVAARDPALGWFYNHRRGWAYLTMGQFSQAADALRQTDFNDSPLLLAVVQMRLGRQSDARTEVHKMMKICPRINSHTWRSAYSFLDPGILDHCAADLIQSGLPER